MLEAAGSSSIATLSSLIENADDLARRWSVLPASAKRVMLLALVERVNGEAPPWAAI